MAQAKRAKRLKKGKEAPGYFADHMEEFYSPEYYAEMTREVKKLNEFLASIGAD